MKNNKYLNIWMAFVNIKAKKGFIFNELLDLEKDDLIIIYKGAWANILIKANSIEDAIKIIPQGLNELNFEVDFIDKIENMSSLIEYNEVNENVIAEVNWLIKSDFVFMISDKLFPYK